MKSNPIQMKKTFLIGAILAFMLLASVAGYIGGSLAQRRWQLNWLKLGINEPTDGGAAPWFAASEQIGSSSRRYNSILTGASGTPPDFVLASEQSTSAVVYLKTTGTAAQRSFNDWFFGDFFNQRQEAVVNSGSGVIVSADGYIVTNNHVVEKASQVEVVLTNKDSYIAKIVGTDPSTDLALLKIDGERLPVISFSNSNRLSVGEWVLAVGNPFNLTSTVTAGIVSAKGRNLNLVNNLFPIESFIQTDAAINPGNSGGALVNTQGELVGINTAIISRTGAYNGYGFAIPSNIVQKVIRDLREFGSVQRAFFGADVIEIDARVRKQAGLTSNAGVMVGSMSSYGPAKDAGIKEGDVIIAFDGQTIDGKSTFDELLSYHRPGDEVSLVYERSGKRQTVHIKLTNTEGGLGAVQSEKYFSAELGAHFETVSKLEKDRLGISGGVKISQAGQGSLRRMGLRDGLIIVQINRTPITEIDQCIDLLKHSRGQVTVEGVDQGGRRSYFTYFSY
jgi:Do/DeqQ family serine protease